MTDPASPSPPACGGPERRSAGARSTAAEAPRLEGVPRLKAALPPEGELALIAQARSGDGEALAQLWRQHAQAGRRMARRITDRIEPDDLLAEAFLRILVALRRGAGPTGAFRPYLRAVMRSIAIRESPPVTLALEHAAGEAGRPPEDRLESAEELGTLRRALSLLPDAAQAALWHSCAEGAAPREIAAALGLSPNAAAALLWRARCGLRRAWLAAHLSETAQGAGAGGSRRAQASAAAILAPGRRSRTALQLIRAHLSCCDRCRALAAALPGLGPALVWAALLLAGMGSPAVHALGGIS